jgi:hypothetical protein
MPFIRRDGDDHYPPNYADTVFVADITKVSGCDQHCMLHIELCDLKGLVMAVSACDVVDLRALRDVINEALNKIN